MSGTIVAALCDTDPRIAHRTALVVQSPTSAAIEARCVCDTPNWAKIELSHITCYRVASYSASHNSSVSAAATGTFE